MSTDPLGDALGQAEPATAPQPGPAPAPSPSQGPGDQQPGGGYQAPSAYESQPSQPAWAEPGSERSLLERRPEILVGAAMAGGFVAAQLLGRIRGR